MSPEEKLRAVGATVERLKPAFKFRFEMADDIVIMTARPGRIKEIVPVAMPRPRERSSPEFVEVLRHTERLVKEEVQKVGLV